MQVVKPPSDDGAHHARVLVCDDDDLIRFSLCTQLKEASYEVVEAVNGTEALTLIERTEPQCVVLDLMMPGLDGLGVLSALRQGGNDVPVIVVTATGGVDSAITATRLGATAYLQKPFDPRELLLAVERALSEQRLKHEVHALRGRARANYEDFVGRSRSLEHLFEDLRKLEHVVAPTILITGESGTGKEVVARAIHARGPRKDAMLVEVDCTALPEHLAESELFGHEKGSFTDAKATKRGLVEVAAGGILFLDEIGELPLHLQAKLLRALENRTYKRVGGTTSLKIEASVIAATNRDLKKEVEAGRFREDLYYRLNVVTLHIPPLRERRDDIPLLTEYFLDKLNRAFGRAIEGVEERAMALMLAYPWPGNVRELKNVLERIAILGPPGRIGVDDLPSEIRQRSRSAAPAPQGDYTFTLPEGGVDLERIDRELVVQALERASGNQTAAARLLGITRFKVRTRMAKYGLIDLAHGDVHFRTPVGICEEDDGDGDGDGHPVITRARPSRTLHP